MCLSNDIATHLVAVMTRYGLKNPRRRIGTFSRMLWLALGHEHSFENVPHIVNEICTHPQLESIRENYRKTQVFLVEEEQMFIGAYKDTTNEVIRGVCGYEGVETAANKQVIYIRDPAQLAGIEVEDAAGRSEMDYGNRQGTGSRIVLCVREVVLYSLTVPVPGGVLVAGGQGKDVLSLASNATQAFFPRQPVQILPSHISPSPTLHNTGIVQRFCSMRGKFVVKVEGAGSWGFGFMGSHKVEHVEYVHARDLRAVGPAVSSVFVHVMLASSKRVEAGVYDVGKAAREQEKNALWHCAMTDMHNGDTNTDAVEEVRPC